MFSQPPPASARERILTAAVDLFGRHGVRSTSLKVIAAAAGVSPALVIHHYGTKDGLREACDEHVVRTIREAKTGAMADGPGMDLVTLVAGMDDARPMLRYLARVLVEGSPHLDALLDDLVDDALEYTAEAERSGVVRPTADPRGRMVVLTLWSLGTLVLHEQLHRLLGADLLDDGGDLLPYLRPAAEILTSGVLTPEALTTPPKDPS
ncbi:TetR/AcrR family transcriptional regulator [Ornithinimicrobium kibberense]|uniref:TetR/AcrR family transcriptional regulator n=1 Tax=Ornithinimicrobium kibberense TaxID=282060 RepID=A0ABV5UZP0_9MICO|nr:TetR/AcrR family transcriptional regulator [Ornithinimicrobium kibberense]